MTNKPLTTAMDSGNSTPTMAIKPESKRDRQRKAFQERTELILKMRADGITQLGIAMQLGISKQRVSFYYTRWIASLTTAQVALMKSHGTPQQVAAKCYSLLMPRTAKAAVARYEKQWKAAGR